MLAEIARECKEHALPKAASNSQNSKKHGHYGNSIHHIEQLPVGYFFDEWKRWQNADSQFLQSLIVVFFG